MSRVFKVTPKRVKRTNGTVLTPEMEVTVTTQTHTSDPFYNGAKELKEAYMRMYYIFRSIPVHFPVAYKA